MKEKVLVLLDHIFVLPRLGSVHKPDFVHLLEQNSEGIISYMPHPNHAEGTTFLIKQFARYLEPI